MPPQGLFERSPGQRMRWSRSGCALALVCGVHVGAQAQWLSELERLALLRDPAVSGSRSQAQAAQERVVQALAAFGPTATLSHSSSSSRYREAPDNDTRPFTARQSSLQVTQPLIRSALLPALRGSTAQRDQALLSLEQARSEARLRLIEALFELMKARDLQAQVEAQRVAAEEQLAAARRGFQVGLSTVVDVRDGEGRLATVASQRVAAANDLGVKLALLGELVGQPVPELLERGLSEVDLPSLDPGSLQEWLARVEAGNVQIQVSRRAFESAEAEVSRAEHGHAPTLDLNYAYQRSADTGTVTSVLPRRGTNSQVGVAISVPLFASGATQSRVREAIALRDKAATDVEAARRSASIAARQSFSAAVSAAETARSLETAVRALEVALQANRRGYEVGMKPLADVFDTQARLFDLRRDLARTRYEAWLNSCRLLSLAGALNAAAIHRLEEVIVQRPAQPPEMRRPGGGERR